MAKLPKWATPERLQHLTQLAEKTGGGCLLGYRPPEATYHHLFSVGFFELTIADIVVDGDSSKCVCQHCPHQYRTYIDGTDVIVDTVEMSWRVEKDAIYKKPVIIRRPRHQPGLIDDWKTDDREARSEQRRKANRLAEGTNDLTGWGRRFDPIEREKFFERQSPYYLEATGISGLTFRPIAKVRIPSTNDSLFVDVPKHLRNKMTRSQRKRWRRAHIESVDAACTQAVQDYWKSSG